MKTVGSPGQKIFFFGAGIGNYVHIPPDTLYRGGSTSQNLEVQKFGLTFKVLPKGVRRQKARLGLGKAVLTG